jgi:predicted NAD/FAD-binding protein
MWRMLFDIIRFNQFALDLILEDDSRFVRQRNGSAKYAGSTENIGDYLNREGYSEAFRDDYLLPLIGALWSTNPAKSPLDFPAKSLVRFL